MPADQQWEGANIPKSALPDSKNNRLQNKLITRQNSNYFV